MHIVAIDPGLGGAVAVLSAEGTLEALADTPTLTLKVQRGTKQVYDMPGMASHAAAVQRPAGPCAHRGVATYAGARYS